MIERYLIIEGMPELRPEASAPDKQQGHELLMHIPIDEYWEIEEIVEKIRYCIQSGESPTRYWKKLIHKVPQFLVLDRERHWFVEHVGH